LAQAQLRLERTSISLPYDVLIVEENIDLGGYAEVGHKLAVAYGIDAFEVEVSFGDDGWAGVDLLGDTNSVAEAADEDLPEVDVEALIAGGLHRWIGYVARMAGQGDPTSGDVPAVIDVPRPLDGAPGRPPLLPGMIVEATMPGRTLTGVIAVPHSAIDDQNRVWTVVDGRLHGVSAGMAWSDEDFSYVTTGIPDGTVIALDFPWGACEGMPVRVVGEAASADEP
jgi:multidrug efflux pump subunit AcrA (membrane-fusion protein)